MFLAEAWVAAAEGTKSEAVVLAQQAAEVATSQEQPAVEVFAPSPAFAALLHGD